MESFYLALSLGMDFVEERKIKNFFCHQKVRLKIEDCSKLVNLKFWDVEISTVIKKLDTSAKNMCLTPFYMGQVEQQLICLSKLMCLCDINVNIIIFIYLFLGK